MTSTSFNASTIVILIKNKAKCPTVWMGFLFLVGISIHQLPLDLPFSLQASLVAVGYLWIGHLASKRVTFDNFYLFLVCVFIWIVDLRFYSEGDIDLAVGKIANVLCFIGSIAATYVVVYICRIIIMLKNLPDVIRYCGRNSLCFLCLHGFELFIIPINTLFRVVGINVDMLGLLGTRIICYICGIIILGQFKVTRNLFGIKLQ